MRPGNREHTVTLKYKLCCMTVGLCTVEWALFRSTIWTFFSYGERTLWPSPSTLDVFIFVSQTLSFWVSRGNLLVMLLQDLQWVSLLVFCTLITQVMLSITRHMVPEDIVLSLSLSVPRIFIFSLLTPFSKFCKTWSPVMVWPQVNCHLMCTWGHPWQVVSSFYPL